MSERVAEILEPTKSLTHPFTMMARLVSSLLVVASLVALGGCAEPRASQGVACGQAGGTSVACGQGGGTSVACGQAGGTSVACGQAGGSSIACGQAGGTSVACGQAGGSTIASR